MPPEHPYTFRFLIKKMPNETADEFKVVRDSTVGDATFAKYASNSSNMAGVVRMATNRSVES